MPRTGQDLVDNDHISAGDAFIFDLEVTDVDPGDISAARWGMASEQGAAPALTLSLGSGIVKASNGAGGTVLTVSLSEANTAALLTALGKGRHYHETEITTPDGPFPVATGAVELRDMSLD